MNNTPIHFIFGVIMVITFLITVFKLTGSKRKIGLRLMHILFIPVFFSGVYIWTLVPFSLPLLIKSVAATIAFYFMTKIVKEPSNLTNWIVCGVLISIGGTLAITMI
jgi:hypothetical protein